MELTHKIWLGNGRISHLRPLVRQASNSPYIFACISKNRLGWIPVVFVHIACTASYQATMGYVFSSQHPCAMFDGISDECETTASLNCEKRTIHQERGQRTRTGENRKQQSPLLCDKTVSFLSVLWRYLKVRKHNLSDSKTRRCSDCNIVPNSRWSKCPYILQSIWLLAKTVSPSGISK